MYQEFLKKQSLGNQVSVLVAPRDASLTHIKAATAGADTAVVEDHSALEMLTSEILDNSRFTKIKEGARKLIKNLPLEGSYQAATGDKYAVGLYPYVSPSSGTLPRAYIVYENEISPPQLSALIAPLSICSEETRPKVIFRPVSSAAALAQKFRPVSGQVQMFEAGPYGLVNRQHLQGDSQSYSESDALDLYLNFGFDTLANINLELTEDAEGQERSVAKFYKMMFQVNAKIRSTGRISAQGSVLSLIHYVDELKEKEVNLPNDELLRMRAFVNVLHGFVFENSRDRIQNTMAIGHHLEDEFLIALGERLINLVEGVDPSALKWLQSAERRFWRLGEPVQAAYAKHNRLITLLSTSQLIDTDEFSGSAEQLFEMAPYCERMSSVRQGAAIANLVNANPNRAHELYSLALKEAGSWLQIAEARVGKLICEFLLGELNSTKIEQCARGIVANIGHSEITYHHKRLAYNLLKLEKGVGSKSHSATVFLEASLITMAEANNLELFFSSIAAAMPVSAPRGALAGGRGAFFKRTGLAPGCGFVWH